MEDKKFCMCEDECDNDCKNCEIFAEGCDSGESFCDDMECPARAKWLLNHPEAK